MYRTALLFIEDVPTAGAPARDAGDGSSAPDAGGEGAAPGARGGSAVQVVRDVLAQGPFVEVDYERVPDEQARIRSKLRLWCDREGVALVLTCGGIGLGLRERVPEAMAEVVERELPGIGERMRAEVALHDPLAVLSRGTAGVRRRTLVVNLPGGATAAGIAARSLLPVLAHALGTLGAAQVEGAAPGGAGSRRGAFGVGSTGSVRSAAGGGAEAEGGEVGGSEGEGGRAEGRPGRPRDARSSGPRGGRGG